MSQAVQATLPPSEAGQVKRQIRRRYGRISETGFDRGEGAARARRAGYPKAFLDRLPGPVVEAYCGCGNPLDGRDLTGVDVAVDLGCGAGLDTRLLAEVLQGTCLVVGVDMTPGMATLADAGAVRAVVADIERLPLADAVADLVVANASFNLALDKRAAFAEARRILKPGGRLAARDLVRDGDLPNEIVEDPLAWNTSLGGVIEETALRELLETEGFAEVCISGHRPFPPVTSIEVTAIAPE